MGCINYRQVPTLGETPIEADLVMYETGEAKMDTDRAKRLAKMNRIAGTAFFAVSILGFLLHFFTGGGEHSLLPLALGLYVYGTVCTNRSRHFDNELLIADLQNRISAFEVGSPNDAKSGS